MSHLSEDRSSADETWTGHATSRLQWVLAGVGAAFVALGVLLTLDTGYDDGSAPFLMSVVGCFAAGLLALFGTIAFVKVRVHVDARALEVRCGPFGLPRRHIPLEKITDAEFQAHVTPCHWGGWGYRWRPEKGSAVIVRRGEGVLLRLADGHTFTVTVDGAEEAVRDIRARLQGEDGELKPLA